MRQSIAKSFTNRLGRKKSLKKNFFSLTIHFWESQIEQQEIIKSIERTSHRIYCETKLIFLSEIRKLDENLNG